MPDRPATYREIIQHEATAAGIPPEVAFAIVDTESSGDPAAVGAEVQGQGRARGLFQLMPATAQSYGVDPADPIQNIRGGIRMLADLNRQYKGDVGQMLAAYHGGPNLRQHGPKTRAYVQTVLGKLAATTPSAPPPAKFQANPQEAAKAAGVPAPAPLPQYGVGMRPPDPRQFEESNLQQAVKHAGPFVTPTLGALAGGVAGAFAGGPPGAFAGATTGGVVGEKAQIELEKAVGLPPPKAELTRLALAGAAGIAGEGVGQAVAKVAAPFAKSVTTEGYATLRKLGGRVTPAQVTDNRFLDIAENIASKSLTGGGRMAAFREQQQSAVKDLVNETVGKIGTAAGPEDAGQAFLSALEGNVDAFHAAARPLFSAVDQTTRGAGVATMPLREFAQQELQRIGSVPAVVGDANLSLLQQVLDLPEAIPFEQAQYLRSRLLARGRNFTDPDKATTRAIADQLTQRVDTAMAETAQRLGPDVEAAFRRANEFYRAGKAQYESEILTRLAQKDPSKVVDSLMGARAAVEPIRAARAAVTRPAWKQVQGAAVDRLITQATNAEGLLVGDRLVGQLKTLGRAASAELFEDRAQDLYSLAKVLQQVQHAQGDGAGSVWIQLTQGSAVSGLGAGVFFGNPGVAAASGAILLAPNLLARVLTHPKGAQWLTTGLQVRPGTREALRLATLIAGAAAKGEVVDAAEDRETRRERMGAPPPGPATPSGLPPPRSAAVSPTLGTPPPR